MCYGRNSILILFHNPLSFRHCHILSNQLLLQSLFGSFIFHPQSVFSPEDYLVVYYSVYNTGENDINTSAKASNFTLRQCSPLCFLKQEVKFEAHLQ